MPFKVEKARRYACRWGCVKANRMTTNVIEARDFDAAAARPPLVDPFGRDITYLRVSVTDRCDFRCVYCMAENMNLPAES